MKAQFVGFFGSIFILLSASSIYAGECAFCDDAKYCSSSGYHCGNADPACKKGSDCLNAGKCAQYYGNIGRADNIVASDNW